MSPQRFWQLRITETNGNDCVIDGLELTNYPHSINLISPEHNVTQFAPIEPTFSSVITNTLFHYEFTQPQIVGAYSFTANGLSAPKSWVLEFSDDGNHWTLAHIEYAQRNWLNERRRFVAELYELTLSLNGSNAARWFNAFIHDLSGELILKKTVFNGSTTVLMPDSEPVSVTIAQECGTKWQALKTYFIDDLVFPNDPSLTPYYYRNRKTAMTADTEPVWSTNPNAFTNDSGCVWELVERLNQPITQYPLIPTRKL